MTLITPTVVPNAPAVDHVVARAFEVTFTPADSRVRRMRQVTADQLRLWNLVDLRDDAMIVVSELVTNAIRHGKGRPIRLRVTRSDTELRVEVADGNPTPARLRSAGETDENGRGLELVAALSKDWGVSPDGTTTWCSLAIPHCDRATAGRGRAPGAGRPEGP
ncbi:anti-sigma regulatory factor [Streptomyces sp. SA15]|uniref:ATP-binding protein n=1 Tax=Streptomyces sp. SA15 TaxID=934019 RepID=UPI000BAFEA4B|nr:ATP-binding protein [Streptomyces sp. SA15]PAZ12270.1 anti-sigma regulatory factor [Streptomyces sp. SA15]